MGATNLQMVLKATTLNEISLGTEDGALQGLQDGGKHDKRSRRRSGGRKIRKSSSCGITDMKNKRIDTQRE